MEERNAQIEKEDEEKKAADLKERKRKVLGKFNINNWLQLYMEQDTFLNH